MIRTIAFYSLSLLSIVLFFLYRFVFVDNNKIDYYFKDSRVYSAPKSQLKIQITTSGYVLNGQDLGYGISKVKLYRTDFLSDTLFLKTSPENIDSITYKKNKISFSCSKTESKKLYDFLLSIGYKKLDFNEVKELRDAMTYINYGAKARLERGQTKFIIVEK